MVRRIITWATALALPITSGKFVSGNTPLLDRAGKGRRLATLPLNTRVEITGETDPKHTGWSRVIITDGAQVGKRGWSTRHS